jgi:hypothetical protein
MENYRNELKGQKKDETVELQRLSSARRIGMIKRGVAHEEQVAEIEKVEEVSIFVGEHYECTMNLTSCNPRES